MLLFRPEQNAIRMKIGAERMCMASPSIEHFVHALKQTVLANKRWVRQLIIQLLIASSFNSTNRWHAMRN